MAGEGPNLLGTNGAATLIGRDGCEVQIRITCGTEEEAKAILEGFAEQIRETGRAIMHFGGTIDDNFGKGQAN